jgi:hypothetical protein
MTLDDPRLGCCRRDRRPHVDEQALVDCDAVAVDRCGREVPRSVPPRGAGTRPCRTRGTAGRSASPRARGSVRIRAGSARSRGTVRPRGRAAPASAG